MKAIHVAAFSAVLGATIGAAVGYVRVGDPQPLRLTGVGPNAAPGQIEARPKIVVAEPAFDFGTMQVGAKQRHEFVVRNEGDAPLRLTGGEPSCKCTAFDVEADQVPPGGEVRIALEWVARALPGPFRQTAPLHTNDPARRIVELAIEGQVIEPSGLTPSMFEMGDVRAGSPSSTSIIYFVTDDQPIELTASAPSRVEAEGKFSLDVQPATQEELKPLNGVAGRRITLTAKDNLPVGQIMEWVKMRIGGPDDPDARELDVPVMGRVVGDITVHGGKWNESAGVLNLGAVSREEGAKTRLLLSVKGEHAGETRFEVASTDPPELKVEIGDPQQRSDNVYHTYFTIEIPKGTRPMVRLNTPQGDDGVIRLKTTHPLSPEVVIGVRFAVTE